MSLYALLAPPVFCHYRCPDVGTGQFKMILVNSKWKFRNGSNVKGIIDVLQGARICVCAYCSTATMSNANHARTFSPLLDTSSSITRCTCINMLGVHLCLCLDTTGLCLQCHNISQDQTSCFGSGSRLGIRSSRQSTSAGGSDTVGGYNCSTKSTSPPYARDRWQ